MTCAGYPETDGVPDATRCSSRARPCVVSLACGDRVASEAPPEGVVSVPRKHRTGRSLRPLPPTPVNSVVRDDI